jgi:predicted ATPase/class 3 adenylate cyclase
MLDLPRGTVAFLFTDIEGSTALWERDRQVMAAAVARQLAILQSLITAHHGVLYKTVGDGTQAAFGTAEEALRAALASQRALLAEDWAEPLGPLRVRMALHAGEAVPDAGGDYLAAPLNRLSRLLSAGHGGQILLSQAVQQLTRGALPAGTTLQDLGEHRLRDLLEPERVYQLQHPDLLQQFPALKTLESRPHNLPLQPTSFLGREHEVQRVADLLRRPEVRFLTLTGPGGTGKTRLALQAAAELLDEFADGVYFVPLASLTNPDLVLSTIATTLGIREEGGQPLQERLQEYLAAKHLLLVLDNMEHLVDAAPHVGELLSNAPGLTVLATSRLPLRLRAEREYAVPPLGLPRRKPPPTLEQLSQFEAVRLFIERAQAIKADFTIDNATAPAVAEICHRLDGLPLAIELAAARIRMLSPQTMLSRLEQRLPLLTGGARDAPARQQTLRNAIAWSYDLLSPEEQILFRRLAVFAGGASFDAVEAVANAHGALDVFSGLERLLEHSLLRQDEGPESEPRFTMLHTIREFGGEQLEASGEADATWERHAAFFLALAKQAEPALIGLEQGVWLDRLEVEHDNLRAALTWVLEVNPEGALCLATALFWFWYTRHLSDGRAWLDQALTRAEEAPTALRAKALGRVATLTWMQGDYERAATFDEAALHLARQTGALAEVAYALVDLGVVELNRGDQTRAKALLDDGLHQFRELADEWGTALALNCRAEVMRAEGDHARALAFYEEAASLFRSVGSRQGTAMALMNVGDAARHQGDHVRAVESLREGLVLAHEVADQRFVAGSIINLAAVAANAPGWAEQAARLLGSADARLATIGATLEQVDRASYESALAATRVALGDQAFVAAYQLGQSLTPEQGVTEALALADELVASTSY